MQYFGLDTFTCVAVKMLLLTAKSNLKVETGSKVHMDSHMRAGSVRLPGPPAAGGRAHRRAAACGVSAVTPLTHLSPHTRHRDMQISLAIGIKSIRVCALLSLLHHTLPYKFSKSRYKRL